MEIRPASFGDNLNEWFRLLGRTWKPLLLSSLVGFVPISIVIGLVFAFTGAGQTFIDLLDPDYLATAPETEILDQLVPFISVMVVWTILQTVATMFVYLAASRTVAEDRAGLEPSWRSVSSHASKRLVPTLLGALLATVAFALAATLAAVIGWLLIDALGATFLGVFSTTVVALTTLVLFVWVGFSIVLFPQAITMEDIGAPTALQRSFRLIQGRWWISAGFIVVTSLIASAVAQVLGITLVPLSLFGAFVPAALGVVYALAIVIQGPLSAVIGAANAVWYLDLRSREEPLMTEQIV